MMDPRTSSEIRSIIKHTLPEETSLFGKTAEVRFTHVPASHAKALHPDNQLVVGMRGAGKSFWWAALQSDEHRALISKLLPRAGLGKDEVSIAPGFGDNPQPDHYPGRDVLTSLVADKHEPRLIWLTVILHALTSGTKLRGSSWKERVSFVEKNPEEKDRLLFEYDRDFDKQGIHWVVLFDALDRSASDWTTMHALIRGLLQATLDLRPYRRLRTKCFLRSDQLNEREVATFPDASKVLAAGIELTWPSRELYSLLFQYLGNSDNDSFRVFSQQTVRRNWQVVELEDTRAWLPPEELKRDEHLQRELFHLITGPWMGRDRRRGFPYTWVPNHLADAEGRTSPRSFIAALRKAATETIDRYSTHPWPLHYESIKQGVHEASSIRKKEIQEDYPWVHALMEPLRGKVVPCNFDEIAEAWRHNDVVFRLREGSIPGQDKLPPAHLDQGEAGVRVDLEDLGIFLQLKDGRVNIPDVFRLSYGLGRRGGVRPIRAGNTR